MTESPSPPPAEVDTLAGLLRLRAQTGPQRPALMFYPAGVELIEAFFGFLYAGVVAVPVYWHAPGVFMPPAAFLQEPLRWLRAVRTHRGTIGGAPNFAYDLCARRGGPAEPAGLDLSSWQVAPVGPARVGEVWLSGPSAGQGYWRRPRASAEIFGNTVPGEPGRWVRTGDLGFLDGDGELYVTGRSKDVIILRGRSLYPQDVEHTAASAHPVLRPGCGAASTIEAEQPRLVVVQEVRDSATGENGADPVAAAAVAAVVRTDCGRATQRLLDLVVGSVADWLGLDPALVDPGRTFASYGMDSAAAVQVSGELARLTGRRPPPGLLYDHPTPAAAAAFLAAPGPSTAQERPAGSSGGDPIAVIGIGCRFPGAPDPAAFWRLLVQGRDAVTEVPADRWDLDAYYDPALRRPGTVSTRWGGFLPDVTGFDADFFGIAPAEALGMDPQQRLLLEVAWEALEHAGIAPASLAGSRTGVFAGISTGDYARLLAGRAGALDSYHGTGNALCLAANRVSYTLDLRGPSLAIDTACSSSLVAVHQACASLRRGESELALAGGVNLVLSPELTAVFSRARMMAADGRCKVFDERADGYVRAEGCGVVVLRPLAAALAAGDRVLAVVHGSAVNQDGRSNGRTAPNGPAQRAVLRAALDDAGVRPAELGYVEAHGTGTQLGDPIEYAALAEVLADGRPASRPCLVGSVKTNIGHLEAAAGIAGLVKVVLALWHGVVPAHLHLTRLSPHLVPDAPLRVPTSSTPWPADRARLAGVSAFGFGGTNAHVVLGQAPDPQPGPPAGQDRDHHVLTLSAGTAGALAELAGRYLGVLRAGGCSAELADLCHTANAGRNAQARRLAVVGSSRAELAGALESELARAGSGTLAGGAIGVAVAANRPSGVGFLFSGQGAQHPEMGAELYRTAPAYREAFDRCAASLGADLAGALHYSGELGEAGEPDGAELAQPALFALEYALAAWWLSCGVVPGHLLGHSVGEYVAACRAGVFDLDDALRLVALRGRLMQALPAGGAMAAVRAGAGEVHAAVAAQAAEVSVAAVNGPDDVVVSGTQAGVEAVLAALGAPATRLRVSHAFHSPLMQPMLAEFHRAVGSVYLRPPVRPVVSTVTGRLAGPELATAEYWVRQLREPVLFGDAVAVLAAAGCGVLIEIGPHAVLAPIAARRLSTVDPAPVDPAPVDPAPVDPAIGDPAIGDPAIGDPAIGDPAGGVAVVASLRRGRPDWEALLGAVGAVWTAGVPIDWRAVDAPHRRRRAELPTYPFQRTRLWLPDLLADLLAGPVPGGCDGPGGSAHLNSPGAPLLGHRLPEDAGLPGRHVWQRRLTGDHTALLADHRSQGQVVMPGVGYVEMAMAAARELAPGRELAAQDVEYLAVLALPPQTARTVQVTLQAEPGASDNGLEFTVHSRPAGGEPGAGWLLHAAGRLVTSGDTADDSTVPDAAGAGVSGASTTGASTARAGG